jgi:membrane associated rhomboid family serine protease
MLNPYRHLTIIGLIAICAIVFAVEQMQHNSWSKDFGAVPTSIVPAYRELISGHWSLAMARNLSRLVTALFLHADIQHIGYNMVFLWAFGYLTSQILGQWRTLAIFMFCGICGNIFQVWFNADSPVSIIGASGAISGLAGVYLGLAVQWRLPYAEVWPLAHPVPPMQVGAFAILGFIGDMVLLARHDQQIAYGAHLGGLLTGVVIAAVITTVYPAVEAYNRPSRKNRA